MSSDFEGLDLIINKLFNFIEYLYEKIYDTDTKEFVNIELGNLYTIKEEDEEYDDYEYINIWKKLVEEFILVWTYNKFYIWVHM